MYCERRADAIGGKTKNGVDGRHVWCVGTTDHLSFPPFILHRRPTFTQEEEWEYKLGDESSSMFGPPDGAANLTNWGENWFGKNLIVHHPKTYEEVAG